MIVFLLYREISDQYGTDEVVGAYTSMQNAKMAASHIRDRRSWISEWTTDLMPKGMARK